MFHDVSLCHFFWFKMIMGVYSSFLQPWLHHGRSHILRSTFVGRGVWPSSPQLSSMTFLSCHFSSMASSSAASLDRSSLWTAGMLQRGRFHRKTSDSTVAKPIWAYGTKTCGSVKKAMNIFESDRWASLFLNDQRYVFQRTPYEAA